MPKNQFSQYSMKNILKSQSYKNVSAEAATELGEELEQRAKEVGETAVELAAENDRKTVREEDVKEALRRMN